MGYVEEIRALVGHKRIILNGSAVILENKNGLILMQQRKYPYGKWALPGGLMELGESTVDTAKREILEETGLSIGDLTLLGVYSGKDYLCSAANGDEWYVVTTAYITNEYSGILSVNDNESIAFEWIDPNRLPDGTAKTHRFIVSDYLRKKKGPCSTKTSLIQKAAEVRAFSYSPYSGFKVGAALLTSSGRVYTGVNIESASYTPTICAERTAFAKAVSEGERDFEAIAITGPREDFCYPCGVCLQVMAEFTNPELFLIYVTDNKGRIREHKLIELLPYGFTFAKGGAGHENV